MLVEIVRCLWILHTFVGWHCDWRTTIRVRSDGLCGFCGFWYKTKSSICTTIFYFVLQFFICTTIFYLYYNLFHLYQIFHLYYIFHIYHYLYYILLNSLYVLATVPVPFSLPFISYILHVSVISSDSDSSPSSILLTFWK